jgi:hypothetical protein
MMGIRGFGGGRTGVRIMRLAKRAAGRSAGGSKGRRGVSSVGGSPAGCLLGLWLLLVGLLR